MFKKYCFAWSDRNGEEQTSDFFVHSKGTRSGFMHRACVIGPLPRLDDYEQDYYAYRRNSDIMFKKRVQKVSYVNRTWEYFSGQECLAKLWDKLAGLKFLDMGRIRPGNPFRGNLEPGYEELYDPEDLFGEFDR